MLPHGTGFLSMAFKAPDVSTCVDARAGLVARERDVELAVVWQVERAADGLGEQTVALWAGLDLERICPPIKVHLWPSDCQTT